MKKSKSGGRTTGRGSGFCRSLNHSSVHPDNHDVSTASSASFFHCLEDPFGEELLAIDREMMRMTTKTSSSGESHSNLLDYYFSNRGLEVSNSGRHVVFGEKGIASTSSASASSVSHKWRTRGGRKFGRRRVSLNDVDFTGGSRRESHASTCSGGESLSGCSSSSGSGNSRKSRGGNTDRDRDGKGGSKRNTKKLHYSALRSLFGAGASDSRENAAPSSSGSPLSVSGSSSKAGNGKGKSGKNKKKLVATPRRHSISEIIPSQLQHHYYFHSKKSWLFDKSSDDLLDAKSASHSAPLVTATASASATTHATTEINQSSSRDASVVAVALARSRPKFRPPVELSTSLIRPTTQALLDSNLPSLEPSHSNAHQQQDQKQPQQHQQQQQQQQQQQPQSFVQFQLPLKSQPRKSTRRSSSTTFCLEDFADGSAAAYRDNAAGNGNGKRLKRMTKLARRIAANEREALELDLDDDYNFCHDDCYREFDEDLLDVDLDRLDLDIYDELDRCRAHHSAHGMKDDDNIEFCNEGVEGAIARALRGTRGATSSPFSSSSLKALPSASTSENHVEAVSSSSHFPSTSAVTTTTAAASSFSMPVLPATSGERGGETGIGADATARPVVVDLTTRLKSEPARPTRRFSSTNYQRLSATTLEEVEGDGSINCFGDFKDEELMALMDEYHDHMADDGGRDGDHERDDDGGRRPSDGTNVMLDVHEKDTRRRSSTYLYDRQEVGGGEEKQLEYGQMEQEGSEKEEEKIRKWGNDYDNKGNGYASGVKETCRTEKQCKDQGTKGGSLVSEKMSEGENDDDQPRANKIEEEPSSHSHQRERKPTRRISSDRNFKNNNQTSSDEEDERADGIGNFGTDRNSIVGNKYQRQHRNHNILTSKHKAHTDSHATFQTEVMSTSTSSNLSYQNLISSRQHYQSQAHNNSQCMIQLLQGGPTPGSSRSGSVVSHGGVHGATAATSISSTGIDFKGQISNDITAISENTVIQHNKGDDKAEEKMGRRLSRREQYRKTKTCDRDSLHLSDSDSEGESIFGSNPYRESIGDLANDISTRSMMIDEEEDEEYQRHCQQHDVNKDDCSNIACSDGNGSLSDVGGGRRARRRVSNFLFKKIDRREDGSHASSGSTHGSNGLGVARAQYPSASRSPSSEKSYMSEVKKEAVLASGTSSGSFGDAAGSGTGNSTGSGGRRGLERSRSGSQRGPNPFAFF